MDAVRKALFSVALFLGACGPDEPTPVAAIVATDTESGSPLERRAAERAGRFSTLDTNGDGAVSQAEIAGHELAPLFAELDGDGDDAISRAEFRAFKHARRRHLTRGQARGQARG